MSDDSDLKWWEWLLLPVALPIIVIGGIAELIGDLFGLVEKSIEKNIDIMLYGPVATGKTTFYNFITSQKIGERYNASSMQERISLDNNETIKVNTKQYTTPEGKIIKFRKTLTDLPGESSYLKKIVETIEKEDENTIIWIVYFIALPMIIEEDYLEIDKKKKETIALLNYYSNNKYTKTIESDLGYIRGKIGEHKKVYFLMIFNFADLYPLYSHDKSLFKQRIGTYVDNWLTRAGGKGQVEYVIGSLKNEQEAQELTKAAFAKIADRTKSDGG